MPHERVPSFAACGPPPGGLAFGAQPAGVVDKKQAIAQTRCGESPQTPYSPPIEPARPAAMGVLRRPPRDSRQFATERGEIRVARSPRAAWRHWRHRRALPVVLKAALAPPVACHPHPCYRRSGRPLGRRLGGHGSQEGGLQQGQGTVGGDGDPDVTQQWQVRPDLLNTRSQLGDPTASSARHGPANKARAPGGF